MTHVISLFIKRLMVLVLDNLKCHNSNILRHGHVYHGSLCMVLYIAHVWRMISCEGVLKVSSNHCTLRSWTFDLLNLFRTVASHIKEVIRRIYTCIVNSC